jgi:glutamate/tyrosine decarboxylase-like PLP-dependent enzyme
MNPLLAQDSSRLSDLLEKVVDASLDYLGSIDKRPPATDFVRNDPLNLPDDGLGAERTLDLFAQRYGRAMPASNGPRFWGFVTGGTTPAALVGDWLTSVYDLNLTSAANSPAPNIELEAIQLLRELFGLPAAFTGTFVTGATMANFAGLALGREWIARQFGKSVARDGLYTIPPISVLSGEAHSSIFKVLALLGLGRNSLRAVATLPGDREAVDVEALRRALVQLGDQPCIVVANAGTVNTGDFDDLRTIADLKSRHRFWLHVDAAFGGFAACSPDYRRLLDGIDAADSLTIDAHKWLNVPYDSAMVFTRHRDLQIAVFQNSAAYLGAIAEPPDFLHLSPENSRRLRALPAWFGLMAYGRAGYREIVERNCALARLLGDRIRASATFRLLAPVRLNVVCFTLAGETDSDRVREFLARARDDGRVFLTPTMFRGETGIRAAFSNWRTQEEDIEIGWRAMNDCLWQRANRNDMGWNQKKE